MGNAGPQPLGAPVVITPGTGRLTLSGSVQPPAALPDAGLLMQTLVELGPKIDEGQIVLAVLLPWFDIIKALERDPGLVYQLDWRQWELMVAGAYERAGAESVIVTPRSGDGGRDIIATLPAGVGTVRVIDQVKAYGRARLVTADEARALFGVVVADRASKGFLTTTSDFAPTLREDPVLKEQIGPRIELINGTQLLGRLKELSKK